jgi:hypothetical protein
MVRPLLIFLVLIISGCAGTKYSSNKDPNAVFSKIQTFYCAECLEEVISIQPRYDNEKNRTIIREAITSEMEKRGYTYSEENPDVLIEYLISVENKVDTVVQRTTNYRYWRGFETDAYNYKKGTIFVNMINPEDGLIMWQGSAESVLDRNPKNVEKKINLFIEKIFEQFPAKAN